MSNYRLLSGPFEGEIVEEGQVLDVPYAELDEDLKSRMEQLGYEASDVGKESYENSWDSEETDEAVTMRSVSRWEICLGTHPAELAWQAFRRDPDARETALWLATEMERPLYLWLKSNGEYDFISHEEDRPIYSIGNDGQPQGEPITDPGRAGVLLPVPRVEPRDISPDGEIDYRSADAELVEAYESMIS